MKFHHIKIRLIVLMLVCLLSLMGMTGCASKAPQASLDPMLLDPMRLDQVKSVGVFDEQALAIRVDDPLVITFDSDLEDSTENLQKIVVAYDAEASSTIEIAEIQLDARDSKKLVLPPPMGGWYPDIDYYVMLDDTLTFSDGKILGQTISKTFRVDTEAFRQVSGKLRFPEGLVAPEALKFYVSLENVKDSNLIQEQEVVFVKGDREASFNIAIPESRFGYRMGYELRMHEYTVFDFFEPKGSYGAEVVVSEDREVHLDIAKVPQVYDALMKIRGAVFNEQMSDYEKVVALHTYVKKNMTYNTDVFNPFRDKVWGAYSGDRMSHVLLENNAVCAGFAYTMDYLLNLEGVESSTRFGELVGVYEPVSHLWNVVKLDGQYYNVDFTANIQMSGMDRIQYDMTPTVVFSEAAFGDSMHYPYADGFECTAVDYDSQFRSFWEKYPEAKGKTTTLTGEIVLPKGEVSPPGGMMLNITTSVGLEKEVPTYDFFYYTFVRIPEGESRAPFMLKTVQTGEGMRLSVESGHYGKDRDKVRKFFSEPIRIVTGAAAGTGTGVDNSKALKLAPIQLEEAAYITGELTLDQAKGVASDDLLVTLIAEGVDGTATFEADDPLYFTMPMVEKGKHTTAFKLPVKKSKTP